MEKKEERVGMKKEKKKYRSIFLSDIHLGTKYSNAELLLEFLKSTEADHYYLVGDIIDGWMMRKKVYWPQEHNNVIQFFLKQSKKSVRVTFVTGNHDEFLREYAGIEMGNIKLVNEAIHHGENGKRYLVIHGDQFDLVTMNAKWLALIGGWMYDRMIDLNKHLQWLFRSLNINGFSLSAWAKHNVKEAVNFIGDYENVISDAAAKRCVDGVICGHIHHANISVINGIEYINCGDWVESCTAIVEHHNGKFEIIRKL
jgi:UDP-2,3-diacylglucosamine pyrophosphatase LpxH